MPFGRSRRPQPPPNDGPQPPYQGGWGSPPPHTPPTWGGRPQQFNRPPVPPDPRNRPQQGGAPGVIYLVLLVIAIGIVYAFTKGIF